MNQNKLNTAAVKKWQADENYHPLTCGVDSNHAILVPVAENGITVLKCPDCDYVQHWIPDVVRKHYSDKK